MLSEAHVLIESTMNSEIDHAMVPPEQSQHKGTEGRWIVGTPPFHRPA
jgi:hypothetical protein